MNFRNGKFLRIWKKGADGLWILTHDMWNSNGCKRAWFHAAAPLTGIVFLLFSLQIWQFGVRHYRSTGS